jgi:hypothetical protein
VELQKTKPNESPLEFQERGMYNDNFNIENRQNEVMNYVIPQPSIVINHESETLSYSPSLVLSFRESASETLYVPHIQDGCYNSRFRGKYLRY